MNRKSLLVVTGVCASLVGLVMGCGPGAGGTSYRDFFTAIGIVVQADGKTPVASLPITGYNWVVSFTDGSTVSNPMGPSGGVTTTADGRFTFASNQLELQSGTQVNECTTVCVDWATGSDDVCTDWETSSEDVCTDWETDNSGNDYCANWETDYTDYCANWVTESYDYCATYGQDCGFVYPSRAITDISSAHAEIVYANGASVVTTESQTSTLPAKAIQTASVVDANNNTLVTTKWVETDTFATTLTPAVLSAPRALITAARNSAMVSARKMSKTGTPHFGRTHQPAAVIDSAKLLGTQKIKLEATRTSCGAYPKTLQ